jgi:hypothetical protein
MLSYLFVFYRKILVVYSLEEKKFVRNMNQIVDLVYNTDIELLSGVS